MMCWAFKWGYLSLIESWMSFPIILLTQKIAIETRASLGSPDNVLHRSIENFIGFFLMVFAIILTHLIVNLMNCPEVNEVSVTTGALTSMPSLKMFCSKSGSSRISSIMTAQCLIETWMSSAIILLAQKIAIETRASLGSPDNVLHRPAARSVENLMLGFFLMFFTIILTHLIVNLINCPEVNEVSVTTGAFSPMPSLKTFMMICSKSGSPRISSIMTAQCFREGMRGWKLVQETAPASFLTLRISRRPSSFFYDDLRHSATTHDETKLAQKRESLTFIARCKYINK